MNKIIIIEGCNNSGKTTLANWIIKKNRSMNWKYIKCSQPKGDPFQEYNKILDEIEDIKGNYIIDRFHLGEKVYSYIYRNGPQMTNNDFDYLENRINKLDYLMIFSITDKEFMMKKNIENAEEYLKNDDIDKEIYYFDKAFMETKLDYVLHDILHKDLTKNNLIYNFLRK